MLIIFIGLQVMLFLIMMSFVRMYWWLWHISPGIRSFTRLTKPKVEQILVKTYAFYDDVFWLPKVNELLIQRFGQDIASVIMQLLQAITIGEDK
jgi:hypothetical protein